MTSRFVCITLLVGITTLQLASGNHVRKVVICHGTLIDSVTTYTGPKDPGHKIGGDGGKCETFEVVDGDCIVATEDGTGDSVDWLTLVTRNGQRSRTYGSPCLGDSGVGDAVGDAVAATLEDEATAEFSKPVIGKVVDGILSCKKTLHQAEAGKCLTKFEGTPHWPWYHFGFTKCLKNIQPVFA
mmetsp:Transcript_30237/g.65351  ORF Transcript_30237/g.65351 Transcript_30237/m.65351 type:complete len:184 (-) Transcript_30237:97-648(-)